MLSDLKIFCHKEFFIFGKNQKSPGPKSSKNGGCVVKMGVVFQNILACWPHSREEHCHGIGEHVNSLRMGILP
jgi:hypothetical protein